MPSTAIRRAAAIAAGLILFSPGASAAAASSSDYLASNSGWAAPQTASYVKVKCPSAYPYAKSVSLAISGSRGRLINIATESNPGETRVDFFNGNQYSNPAKNVWVAMEVTCSSIAQQPDPNIRIKQDVVVPAKGLILPGVAKVELGCPANVPFFAGGSASHPTGVDADLSLDKEAPQTATWNFSNWNDTSARVTGYVDCMPQAI
ncbi:hypothetical protein MRQ36_01360 [Micromonospora sp. R77]|uniref:hypothetical protein n=1 Tax=Micromonospora sp. R77 TaxID=2925836 RepID=UPI001F61F2A9|nr:hypothetical protein [Micromonospora sp. R77]MCI4061292.1 hypothetical protein [Micromonospora sp. R77]